MNAYKTPEGKHAVISYYNIMLQKFRIPHEELNINTVCGPTHILAAGKPEHEPLILLHGSSMNSVMWIRDMETFSEHYRVYALDLPGEPGKSSEEQLPLDTLDYVNWLDDVLNVLGINKVNLAGISLGAWLAAKYSIYHPKNVRKLALLCPAGIGGQNHAFKEIAISLLPKGEEGVNELLRMINGGKEIPEIMLNYQKLIAATFNSRQEPIPLFTDKELQRLSMPSLLIVGQKDIMLNSMETAERYGRLVSNSRIEVLSDAGHSLTGLAAEITEFLRQ